MSTHSSRTKSASDEAKELAEQIDAIRQELTNLTKTVSRMTSAGISEAQQMARDKAGEAQDLARETMGDVETMVRRNPLQAALIAMGVGFLIGSLSRR